MEGGLEGELPIMRQREGGHRRQQVAIALQPGRVALVEVDGEIGHLGVAHARHHHPADRHQEIGQAVHLGHRAVAVDVEPHLAHVERQVEGLGPDPRQRGVGGGKLRHEVLQHRAQTRIGDRLGRRVGRHRKPQERQRDQATGRAHIVFRGKAIAMEPVAQPLDRLQELRRTQRELRLPVGAGARGGLVRQVDRRGDVSLGQPRGIGLGEGRVGTRRRARQAHQQGRARRAEDVSSHHHQVSSVAFPQANGWPAQAAMTPVGAGGAA